MPTRSLDIDRYGPVVPNEKVQRKTERSHEENQERAYIAASRRTDRSLEARVQSARMASEIHKKRTGKSFRITEDIVLKEEMYEEEDDDLPRSYRLLGSQMETSSRAMNSRLEAFLSNKLAMSTMLAKTNEEWRGNEINKLFAQSFPNAANQNRQAQQTQQNNYQQNQNNMHFHSTPDIAMAQNFQSQPHLRHNPHGRGHSMSGIPYSPPASQLSMSPLRHNSETPTPQSADTLDPYFDMNSPLELGSSRSAFTTEVPPEARIFMETMNPEGMAHHPFQDWMSTGEACYATDVPRGVKIEDYDDQALSPTSNDLMEMSANMKWDTMGQTNMPMDEPSWDSFINDNAWQ